MVAERFDVDAVRLAVGDGRAFRPENLETSIEEAKRLGIVVFQIDVVIPGNVDPVGKPIELTQEGRVVSNSVVVRESEPKDES